MLERPVLVGDLTERLVRSTDEFDNGSGPVVVDIQNDWVTSTKLITFDTLTRADRWATRRWVHSRSEEHTSELQSLMRISYAVFCLQKTKKTTSTKKQVFIKKKQIYNKIALM